MPKRQGEQFHHRFCSFPCVYRKTFVYKTIFHSNRCVCLSPGMRQTWASLGEFFCSLQHLKIELIENHGLHLNLLSSGINIHESNSVNKWLFFYFFFYCSWPYALQQLTAGRYCVENQVHITHIFSSWRCVACFILGPLWGNIKLKSLCKSTVNLPQLFRFSLIVSSFERVEEH